MRFRRTLVAFTVALVALCIVAGSVQAAPVVNSSFEDDTFGVSPGYISGNGNTSDSITGWIATANDKIGLNTAAGPFADGGTIPAGNQVALIQNSVGVTGSLSQTITGLDIGQTYRVFYNYNGRTGYEFPKIKVSMGGTVLQENEFIPVGAAGNTNPYYAGAREFTATATEHELKFENTRNVGDSTLLVDNIIVEPNTEWGPTIYAWNDDFSSGIDPTATYTHAVNFGGADVTINGIDFTGAAGPDPSGANYSTTGMQNTFINDANNVTGDGAVMANDFLYGGDPSQLTLTGLTPGTEYIATIYTVGFDNQPGSRIASFAASAGAVPLGDLVTFNQNEMGNNNGMAISFRFPAPDTSITIDVDPYTANTWHYYGFSNMEAPLEYNLLWNGDAGDLLWHSANWTGPVATPDANTNTTIINDTVAVSANAAARKLTVLSGGIAIDADWSLDVSLGATFAPGTTLTLGDRASLSAQDVNVGPGAIVTLADGAALVVDSGTIATMTTTGDAAIETRTNNLSVASLTAAAGTISKRGAGALILGSGATVNPATVFKVEQGTLATSGMNPLGPAEVVELAGGTLLVEGGVTGQSAPANAVAHYAFDAEVAGVTPNTGDAGATLDGTLLGNAALTSGGRGISGEAMQFSGGYVEVPYDAALALNEFTVSAWVNVDSDPVTNNGILGTRIGAGNTFDVKVSSNMIHADIGGVNNAWISTAVDIGAGDTGTTGQGGDLGGGEWHLVTYVIDDTNKKFDLYLDGDLKRTITYPADRTPRFMADTQVLWIGDDYAGHEPMVGRIDDVYIYDRALDSMEVGNLWGDGVTIDMATDLLVTADSTLHATAPGPGGMPAQFADLTLKNGTLTTAGVSQGVQFNSTTIHADATAVGFGPQTATDYGTITNSSAMPEVIVSKTGSGTWELGTPFSGTTDNIKWNVEEGTFAVTGDNTLSGQPITIADGVLDAASAASIGSSPVEMTGGTLSVRLPALKNLSSGIDETSGSPIADGDPDPRYVLTVSPQDLPEDLPKPATVILNHPSWLANDEISKWIGPVNPGITDVAAGDYTIEAELDLTGFDIETVAIVGKLASDNSITDVLLNGFSTGFTQAGFGGLSPAQIIDMGLVDGVNTLTFVLNNSGATATPGGLRVEVGLYQAEQILDLSATAITVNGGGTLDLHGPWAAEVGSVVLKTGALTTAGTIAETIFGGTTLDVEAVDVGINTQVPTYTGAVDGTALVAPATLAKTGLSDLVMDQPGVNLSQLTIDVQQGRLIGVHGSDPFEEAKLQLGGGTLELAAPADDAAVAFDSALSVTANSTLTGGPGLTGTSGAQVTLGSAANGITLGAGTVLTVQTTNDYALELAGVIAGADATVQVPQGDVTLGGGGNIGSLLVPGGSLEASGDVNVNTLSVQGSGAISTAPGGVSVNDGGTAEIGVTTFATTGGTMSFAGSVLATGADTLILGGGDVIATALSPGPPVAGLSYHRITNDADSGIDSAKTYTHAIDFGTDTTATVNGVVFAADFDGNGDFNNTAEHVGGAGPYLVDTNSAVWSVFDDMDYSGTEVLLTGLTPGETYDLRFYNRAWGVGADRRQTFSYDVDADGSIDNPPGPITFNADDSSADPPAMGNADAAYAMSYVYTAGDTGEIKVGIAAEIAGNTYHFYGLTNEIATGPLETLPADVTLQNLVGTGTINAAAVDVMHTIAPGNDGIGKITVGVAELGMDGGATYNAEISLADVTAVVADQIEVVEGGLLELGGTLAVATLDDRADNSSWSNPKLKVVHNAYGEIGDTLFADVTAGGEPAVEGVVTHIGQGAFLRGVTYTEAPVAEPFATGVELDVFVALGGDADGDEKVWLSDWAALRANFGNTGAGKTWTEGNFDPWVDDKVWLSDWAALRANFGNASYVPAGAAAVPEPGTIVMLLAGLLCVASLWRRRRVR